MRRSRSTVLRHLVILSTVLLRHGIQAVQPGAPQPIAAPLRDLPWSQLNFLHTTDIHGWHAGHLQEPFYSADWGDYISFAQRMKEHADAKGVDLLLMDTGDRVEGNGLYDASKPKGNYSSEIFKHQDIDVLCSGNHELYKKHTAEEEYLVTVPNFKGNYLSSNIDIYNAESDSFVPLAPRFRKFTTANQGIRVLAFGFLFDFKGNYNNTSVQLVEETIQEKWFQEAIRDQDVDIFVVIGHVAIRSKEYRAIHTAIREVRWDTPIQFFGGHSHIRDYAVYDSKSTALESGRYLETIGFMSIEGLKTGGKAEAVTMANPSFARRYIDNNLLSFYHHTGLNSSTFSTELGHNVTKYIADARKTLKLDKLIGCAPQNYWLNRAEYPGKDSIFSWLQDSVLPDIVHKTNTSRVGPTQIIINTGVMRFDIFKGPFTKDTAYIVSPFTGGFQYLKDVPYEKTKQLLTLLNNHGPVKESLPDLDVPGILPPQRPINTDNVVSEHIDDYITHGQQSILRLDESKPSDGDDEDLQPGYTTKDDAGDDGDDTIHSPIIFHSVPDFIEVKVSFPQGHDRDGEKEGVERRGGIELEEGDPETVDLIFLEFIQPWILLGLKFLGQEYTVGDVLDFADRRSLTSLLTAWIGENWKGDCT